MTYQKRGLPKNRSALRSSAPKKRIVKGTSLPSDGAISLRMILGFTFVISIIGLTCEHIGFSNSQSRWIAGSLGGTAFWLARVKSPNWATDLKLKEYIQKIARMARRDRLADYPLFRDATLLQRPLGVSVGVLCALLVIVSVSLPRVEAAALNWRLSSAISPKNNPDVDTRRATGVFSQATGGRIPLDENLVTRAMAQLERQHDPASWQAYVSAVTYRYTQLSPPLASEIEKLAAGKPRTLFSLDGFTYENSSIMGGIVDYRGGNTSITSTSFPGCIFQVADTPNGRRFLKALLNSKNGEVSFASSPRLPTP